MTPSKSYGKIKLDTMVEYDKRHLAPDSLISWSPLLERYMRGAMPVELSDKWPDIIHAACCSGVFRLHATIESAEILLEFDPHQPKFSGNYRIGGTIAHQIDEGYVTMVEKLEDPIDDYRLSDLAKFRSKFKIITRSQGTKSDVWRVWRVGINDWIDNPSDEED